MEKQKIELPKNSNNNKIWKHKQTEDAANKTTIILNIGKQKIELPKIKQ